MGGASGRTYLFQHSGAPRGMPLSVNSQCEVCRSVPAQAVLGYPDPGDAWRMRHLPQIVWGVSPLKPDDDRNLIRLILNSHKSNGRWRRENGGALRGEKYIPDALQQAFQQGRGHFYQLGRRPGVRLGPN